MIPIIALRMMRIMDNFYLLKVLVFNFDETMDPWYEINFCMHTQFSKMAADLSAIYFELFWTTTFFIFKLQKSLSTIVGKVSRSTTTVFFRLFTGKPFFHTLYDFSISVQQVPQLFCGLRN